MRDLGLCLLSALCLAVVSGCTNPSQPPLYDPFVGRTTVPPPGTALTPNQPYLQEGSLPQSRRPGNRTGQLNMDAEQDPHREWQPSGRARLASAEMESEEDAFASAADAEISDEDMNQAEAASYEEPTEDEPQSTRRNPVRQTVSIRANSDGMDGAEFSAATDE